MSKKFSLKKYGAAMDINERTASKRQLWRKIKALYQLADDYSDIEEKDAKELAAAQDAINDLLAHLLEYADELDEVEAQLVAEIRKTTTVLDQRDRAIAQTDQALKLAEELRDIANKALEERNEAFKVIAENTLDQMSLDEIIKPGAPTDLIDGKTITEWHEIAERFEYLNEFNRKRANKYAEELKELQKKYDALAVSDKNIG